MRLTRELITGTGMLILAYLVLTHFTGAARTISALSTGYAQSVKALQGR